MLWHRHSKICFSSCPLTLKLRCAIPIGCLLTTTNSNLARLSWSFLLTRPWWMWYESNYCSSPIWQPHPDPCKFVLGNILGIQPLMAVKSSFLSASLAVSIFQFLQLFAPSLANHGTSFSRLALQQVPFNAGEIIVYSKYRTHFFPINSTSPSLIHNNCSKNLPICSVTNIFLFPANSSIMMLLWAKTIALWAWPLCNRTHVCLYCSWSDLDIFC